jgi:hypothetical protein
MLQILDSKRCKFLRGQSDIVQNFQMVGPIVWTMLYLWIRTLGTFVLVCSPWLIRNSKNWKQSTICERSCKWHVDPRGKGRLSLGREGTYGLFPHSPAFQTWLVRTARAVIRNTQHVRIHKVAVVPGGKVWGQDGRKGGSSLHVVFELAGDRVLPCSLGWNQNHDLPASTTSVLGLRAHPTTPSCTSYFKHIF